MHEQLTIFTNLLTCKGCGETLPANVHHFHIHQRGKYGLRQPCKACASYSDNEVWWDAFHRPKESRDEYLRRWQRENPEKVRISQQQYYQRNREKRKQALYDWIARTPGYHTWNARRRRARKYSAGGRHTRADIRELEIAQNMMCAYCGVSLEDGYHVDHVVPLVHGGTDNPDNLALACPTCNCRKGSKSLEEFLSQLT